MQVTGENNFLELRKKLKHGSMAAVARRFGVTTAYVSRILKGEKNHAGILKALAKEALKYQQEKEKINVELNEILVQITDNN